MKYLTYLVFCILIVVTILFLKNALQPEKEPFALTGSEKCGECHSLQAAGNQNAVWQSSKHSGAYKVLLESRSVDFASKNGLELPKDNKLCLKCHTTEHFLGQPVKQSSYTIEEGVGCEACHGAGSVYSKDEIMKSSGEYLEYGGSKGDEPVCLKCHSLKANKEHILKDNLCPFQDKDFSYKPDFEKIKHPTYRGNFK